MSGAGGGGKAQRSGATPLADAATHAPATEKADGFDNAVFAKEWLCFDSKNFRASHEAEWVSLMNELPESVVNGLNKDNKKFYEAFKRRCVTAAQQSGCARA